MIPLTVGREEMALARQWVEEAVASVVRQGIAEGGPAETADPGGRPGSRIAGCSR